MKTETSCAVSMIVVEFNTRSDANSAASTINSDQCLRSGVFREAKVLN
jgi:hypothetical protein